MLRFELFDEWDISRQLFDLVGDVVGISFLSFEPHRCSLPIPRFTLYAAVACELFF